MSRDVVKSQASGDQSVTISRPVSTAEIITSQRETRSSKPDANPIFGFADPDLPIHYTTFMGL